MKIKGVPEGWELVRIGTPKYGDWWLNVHGDTVFCDVHDFTLRNYPILKKIEKPKRYRPFASAEEFRPFRERWWRHVTDLEGTAHPPRAHCNDGWLTDSWVRLFERIEFDDGSPFGVEVTE